MTVDAGDLDRDGDVDIVVSGNVDDMVAWHENLGGAPVAWNTHVISTSADAVVRTRVADIDGDGRSDFVLGDVSVSNQPLAVLRQRADGSFEVGQEVATGRCEAVAAGDFDRDGDIDLGTVETTGPARVLESR